MATPRSKLVDDHNPMHYHLVSRCVRGAFLCGVDKASGRDFSYRKQWIIDRTYHLAQYFAVSVEAFSIMSNHFHLVAYFDPTEKFRWSDKDVADRWIAAFPPKINGVIQPDVAKLQHEILLNNRELLQNRRDQLGDLSKFMKYLKHPISVRANKEDDCKGHFFEQRFYSGALLTEEAINATMAYVDLNPVRAKIAKRLSECVDTSIIERLKHLEHSNERLHKAMGPLEPLVSGITKKRPRRRTTLTRYIEFVQRILNAELRKTSKRQQNEWTAIARLISKRQRAYGSEEALLDWLNERGMRFLESPFPSPA